MFARLIIILFVLSFLWFIWPTRYKHYAPSESPYVEEYGRVATRVDRLSGDVYVKRGEMWTKTGLNEQERYDITTPVGRTQPKEGASTLERERKTMDRMQEEVKKATKDQTRKSGK